MHRNEDVERVKVAEAACNSLKSRLYQMETVLRAVEKEKNDQAEIVRYVHSVLHVASRLQVIDHKHAYLRETSHR